MFLEKCFRFVCLKIQLNFALKLSLVLTSSAFKKFSQDSLDI